MGENIIFSAPTGSGKTEATLLAIPIKSKVNYFLPTVSAADIMYLRLLNDFPSIKWGIKTSQMSECNHFDDSEGNVIISCPDGKLINYLNNGRKKTLEDVVVLDEYDNYPPMVKTALGEYLKDYPQTQVIVPSATLSDDDKETFKNYIKIEYNTNLNIIKHKTSIIKNIIDAIDIVRDNPNRKIGIIMNSIKGMEYVNQFLPKNTLFLNSQTDRYDRRIIERKLYTDDFSIVCSNDLISFSIDVDFDILIMEASDKLSINLQRMGRNNRRNKRVDYKNLFIFNQSSSYLVPFVDSKGQEEQIELLTKNSICINKLNEWRDCLPCEEPPTLEDVLAYWFELKQQGKKLNLRKVPLKFKYNFQKTVEKWKNNMPIQHIVNTSKTFTFNNVPWTYLPYDTEELDNKCVIRIKGQNYKIVDEKENCFIIDLYDSISYGICPECGEIVNSNNFHFGYCCCYECC